MQTAQRGVMHATFTIERTYPQGVERVFRAFADPEVKRRWFSSPEETEAKYEADFREGGHEVSTGKGPGGEDYRYQSSIFDIVPNQRIVVAYEMYWKGERISVSLQSLEFESTPAGTLLTLTESGGYFENADGPEMRRQGTLELLDAAARELEREA